MLVIINVLRNTIILDNINYIELFNPAFILYKGNIPNTL